MTGQKQGGGGPAQGGSGGRCQPFPIRPPPAQVIDTVPLGEVAEDMFGYFEPLYQVIPDMPRPPETFLKRVTGQAPRLGAPRVLTELSRGAAQLEGSLGAEGSR